jgi:hypothetical protein
MGMHLAEGGGASDIRLVLEFSLFTLLWTVPGSGLLVLTFNWTRGRAHLALRYAVVLLVGCTAGLVLMRGPGFLYGATTALAWIATHLVFEWLVQPCRVRLAG